MSNTTVRMEIVNKYQAIITLNRPEKRNALSIELLGALSRSVEEANTDPNVRMIVLRGSGEVFCAGLDLQEATDPVKTEESADLLERTFKALFHSPKVTVAGVQGAALAGGAGLLCACDFAFAEEGAKLGFPETRRGLVAAQVMPFLQRLISQRHLTELLLLGKTISAQEAWELGLLSAVVPKGSLDTKIEEILESVLQCAPHAIRNTKHLMEQLAPVSLSDQFMRVLPFHHSSRHSEEAAEGVRAFLEKREPAWTKK